MAGTEREQLNVADDLALELIRILRHENKPQFPEPTHPQIFDNVTSPIKALLLDIYGTLFVSASGDISVHASRVRAVHPADPVADEGPIVAALRSARCEILDRAGTEEVGHEEYLAAIEAAHEEKRQLGIEFPEVDILRVWTAVFEELSGTGLIRSSDDPKAPYLAAVTYECRTNPVWPMPGAEELLRLLAAEEFPVGLISNAQFYTPLLFPALLNHSLEELGIDDCLCSWSFRRGFAKPSLPLYDTVREVLYRNYAIAPEEVLYVGNDMLNDMLPAQEVGFSTCIFAGDAGSLRLREDDPRCARVRPDAIAGALGELPGILKIRSSAGKEHK